MYLEFLMDIIMACVTLVSLFWFGQMSNNIQTTIQTRHQCISTMGQYENKSLEELRFQNYASKTIDPPEQQQALRNSVMDTDLSFGKPTINTVNFSFFGGASSVTSTLPSNNLDFKCFIQYFILVPKGVLFVLNSFQLRFP